MHVSSCKKSNEMQVQSENGPSSSQKVNKKVSKLKNPKAANSSLAPETYRESPQNVRIDTSESDEESVSEVMHHSRVIKKWASEIFRIQFQKSKVKIFFIPFGHHHILESIGVCLYVYILYV